MAKFIGTKREYHDFLGPRIRNVVQRITLNEKRKMNNRCAHCNCEGVELEAAHVHGNGRKQIIDDTLEKHCLNGFVEIDIKKTEEEIIALHHPISESFIFICRGCHIKYDSTFPNEKRTASGDDTDRELLSSRRIVEKQYDLAEEEQEVLRVQNKLPRWFKNKNQYNSKILYAFIKLYENDKNVTLEDLRKESNIDTFDSNFNQMRIIAPQNHGKIFDCDGRYVKIWAPVEEILWSYYRDNNGFK